MGLEDVDSVARHMTLASGYVWSVPIVFDISQAELDFLGANTGDSLLLVYQDQPLAVLEVEENFSYDKEFLAQQVFGTTDIAHPWGSCEPLHTRTGLSAGRLPWSIRPLSTPRSTGFGVLLGNSVTVFPK